MPSRFTRDRTSCLALQSGSGALARGCSSPRRRSMSYAARPWTTGHGSDRRASGSCEIRTHRMSVRVVGLSEFLGPAHDSRPAARTCRCPGTTISIPQKLGGDRPDGTDKAGPQLDGDLVGTRLNWVYPVRQMCPKNAEPDPIGNRKLPIRNRPAGVPLFGTGSTRPRASKLSSTRKAVAEDLDRFRLTLSAKSCESRGAGPQGSSVRCR